MSEMADFLDDVFGDGRKRSAWRRVRKSLSPRRWPPRERTQIPWGSIAAAAAPVLSAAAAFVAVLLGRPAAQQGIGFFWNAPTVAVLVASACAAGAVLAVGIWRWARGYESWIVVCVLSAAILAPALVFAEIIIACLPLALVAEAIRKQARR